MTVLRNVESLGRSYRRSVRCHSVMAASRIPLMMLAEFGQSRCTERSTGSRERLRMSLSSLPRYSFRSFSTTSTSDELNPAIVSTPLEVASNEARQVVSKAPQSTALSASSPKEAAEAARAMLALASPTRPLAEAILANKAVADQVASLHQAFLCVTSWCISLIPSDPSLLEPTLDLARRAHDLSLPLHLPLYRSLVSAGARHAKEDDAFSTIMEVSTLAVSALKIPLQASFFSEALVSLMERKQVSDAVLLLRAMKERHDIHDLESKVADQILDTLKETDSSYLDDEDVSDLLNILHDLLMENLEGEEDSSTRIWLTELVLSLMKMERGLSTSDEDDDASDDESDDDLVNSNPRFKEEMDRTELQLLEEIRDTIEESTEPVSSIVSLFDVDVEQNVAVTVGEDTQSSAASAATDDSIRASIYVRDTSSWLIPDVTHQLVKLNGDEDIFYTREYEEQLLNEMFEPRSTDDSIVD